MSAQDADRTESPEEFHRRMDAMLNITRDEPAGDLLRPHMLWELTEIMKKIKPEDLSTSDIMGLLAILVPAHSRLLSAAPPVRPVPLRIV